MRILIIALPRSGGQTLTQWIANEMNYKPYHEPIRMKTYNGMESDGVVVKWLIGDIHNSIFNPIGWDRVIGLKRENIKAGAESHARALERRSWNSRYTITDKWIKENQNEIATATEYIQSGITKLETHPLIELHVSYEKIFESTTDIKRITDYIGIHPQYTEILNPENRYRNSGKFI